MTKPRSGGESEGQEAKLGPRRWRGTHDDEARHAAGFHAGLGPAGVIVASAQPCRIHRRGLAMALGPEAQAVTAGRAAPSPEGKARMAIVPAAILAMSMGIK